jgi:ribosomal protein L16 Arg81 hydroxylase
MTILTGRGEAASTARPFAGLSRLIDPIEPAVFQRDYWERRPLLIQRNDPEYYADLLSLDDVDRLLSLTGVQLDNIRVVMNGKETPVSQLVEAGGNNSINVLEVLYDRYREGSTIVLNSLDQRWEPLQLLSRQLGAEMSARFQANIYLTPAGSQGFAPHYDTHDVFVAQVHGTKHWRLSSDPCELPLHGQPYDKSQPEPTPEQEFDLCAGDMVYLPRGTVHSATSNERASVHITVGVHPILYSTVFNEALRELFLTDVRFRRALPIAFATDSEPRRQAEATVRELLDVVHTSLSPSAMVDGSVRRAASISSPTLRHHLTDLEKLGELWVDTRLRRRTDTRYRITIDGDVVSLDFHNKGVQLPAAVADELRFVAERGVDGFTANEIPGDLDEPGRLVLVQTLLREGFLTLG